uniref:Glutathione S-transferase C-terminal domain-containing protein n=1 Tax=Neogobius melanostomus TaxID=47308 RepID=A0A8C6TAN2_9GOBI
MKAHEKCPVLYLEVHNEDGEPRLPLHTSVVLFLLSYCDCKSFQVSLVSRTPGNCETLETHVPNFLNVSHVGMEFLDETGRLCRAGLAVVLRHIINRTLEADPSRNDVLALLGFKKTCLKACAEVSKWTRLCELGIPYSVEGHLRNPSDLETKLPLPILALEQHLSEPVKVHNDDKIRRQKLKQQQQKEKTQGSSDCDLAQTNDRLELDAALAKLSFDADPQSAARESSEIRKVKTTELPTLEHVFAEGLYFTLTDVVLLPCIHHSLQTGTKNALNCLPHLLRWYSNVQEVPGVQRAAKACGITLVTPQPPSSSPSEPVEQHGPSSLLEREETSQQLQFVGGPRPTLTKLKENGIEAAFSPHPCPAWTLPWEQLPEAINPTEGKMSDVRAQRKRQQLNNLVAMVTELARPGNTIVDFCSGTGHVGIVLAHTLPDCKVILIENKEESLVRAQSRSGELGLPNIGFIQANLDYYTGPFDIGVGLHACGVATDMVMDPCCYGFIQNANKFSFPRSKRFQEILTYKEHMILCRFADQTAVQLPPERRLIGKQCMGLVDLDRSWAAEAHGYSVRVMTMEPESCSPKNNMLVGRPRRAEEGK